MKSTECASASSGRNDNSIPVGVIGAGRLGTFHARKLARLRDVRLVGVADPLVDRREAVAKECRCSAFADYRDLLPHCAAVVVAVPTSLHHRTAMDCLEAGVHVFVEKPITETPQQAHQLWSTAQRKNLVLQVGHIERFNPAYRAVQPLLGDIQLIEASRCGPFSFRVTDVGVVMDLMIHDLDLILAMVRKPVLRTDSVGVSLLGRHEDLAIARIEFEDGPVALLKASRIEQEPIRTMRIWHRAGQAIVDFARRTASVCEYPEEIRSGAFRIEELSPQELNSLKETFTSRFFPWRQLEIASYDPLEAELRNFIDAVRTGTLPLVTGGDGLAAVQLAERILDGIRARESLIRPIVPIPRSLPKAA